MEINDEIYERFLVPKSLGEFKVTPPDYTQRRGDWEVLRHKWEADLEQIRTLWENLRSEYLINQRIYNSKFYFTPLPGHIYHLYSSPSDFLSLIGPKEWNRSDYVGSYQYTPKGIWIPVTF